MLFTAIYGEIDLIHVWLGPYLPQNTLILPHLPPTFIMLGVYVVYVMAKALTAADRKENMNASEGRRVEDLKEVDMSRADMTDALDKIDTLEGVKTPMARGAEILVTVEDKEVARNELESAGYNVEDDGDALRVYFTIEAEETCELCDNEVSHDVVITTGVDSYESVFVCEGHKDRYEKDGVLDYSEEATETLLERHYPRMGA